MWMTARASSTLWDGWTVCSLLTLTCIIWGAPVTGPFSEVEPMDQQPLSNFDFKRKLWRSSWCWPLYLLPGSKRYPKLSREQKGKRGRFDLARKKDKCFLLWLPRAGSISAAATCPPGQSPLEIPLKSWSSKQWSLHKLCSAEYTWFGILPPFHLTVRLNRCLYLLLDPCQAAAWNVFQLAALSLNSHAASVATLTSFHWVSS